MSWIVAILVGAIIGWIASSLMGEGIGGAASAGSFSLGGLFWGVVGAVVLIWGLRALGIIRSPRLEKGKAVGSRAFRGLG